MTKLEKVIKGLEPRVMTRAELELAKLAPVWLDTHRNKIYNGWALCYDIQTGMGITGTRAGITDPSGRVHWLKLDDYGRTWRCWTSRPTDKQREAEPWTS